MNSLHKLFFIFELTTILLFCFGNRHREFNRNQFGHLNPLLVVNESSLFGKLELDNGGDLVGAVVDIIKGYPAIHVTVGFDNHTSEEFVNLLFKKLLEKKISITFYNLTGVDVQEKYFEYLTYHVEKHFELLSIFFANQKMYEHLLLEIYDRNLIRRNIVYIFNWGNQSFHRYFIRNIHYSMKVYAITNPKNNTLFYSQATSHREHHLEKVNWWKKDSGLFYHPTLPRVKSVYKDFKGKTFMIPVLHKPPWHFVNYLNDTIEVRGRDDRILLLLSRKLNFRYEYFDPPERIQGTAPTANGSFKGVLGLIWSRKAEFFIGDVALTYDRSNFVEFSFVTLADSGAFVTHAPGRLNEALALLRPFQWKVWPAIGITFIIVGPVLYIIVALPNMWQPRFRVRSHARLFFDCTWFTITILFKQTGKEPSSSHKARFFIIVLSISATYVINDMYSANLTSLLAKPGRERAINNLYQLEEAMRTREYSLYVERHSSSYGLLENGTGIYGRLWDLMTHHQSRYLVESVEEGVKLVKDSTKAALLAGRETLYFDTQRFGPSNFHLSEKLNTAYSAIAFQLGCPYIEEINRILMAIFEAGIITKMTENEYEKLGKQKRILNRASAEKIPGVIPGVNDKQTRRASKTSENNEKLKPISLKMLQGTFYLLCFGNAFSGIILIGEILVDRHHRKYIKTRKKRCVKLIKCWRYCKNAVFYTCNRIRRLYRDLMHEAFVSTLEYLD